MDTFALPHLTLLKEDQIHQVHAYALKILETTGVRIDSPAMRQKLAQRLGTACLQDDILRLPPEPVEWALGTAPSTIDLYSQQGEFAFRLGQGEARFGIGVTNLFYQDALTDQLTPFSRCNMQDMVRLGACLPNYDVISTVGIVQDVPVQAADLYAVLEMAANTTKPLVLLVSEETSFPQALDLLELLRGDLDKQPCVLPYFNPLTPLVMNTGTLEKMELAVQRGLPVIFSNYSMAGASAPLLPASTFALLIAELLAGLVISQVLRPGAPIVLGILPAYMDLKTMVNFYDPHSMLLSLACAEMMAHYHLPHCGASGSGNGWSADLPSADSFWLNHLTTCLGPGSLAPFCGDVLGSKAFSPNLAVYVHEIIAQSRRYAAGFDLSEGAAALEEIDRVGPAGNFLAAPSTRANFRSAYYSSPYFPRWGLEKWQAQGSPRASDYLRQHTCQLLSNLPVPAEHDELIERGEKFIRQIVKQI
ncbi:MAG: trimethylamine methyltransferase family protein [Anaerolineales bacterium]|nr:trimethylamine methyltransferase family protein [Anaerolineales bacterium]